MDSNCNFGPLKFWQISSKLYSNPDSITLTIKYPDSITNLCNFKWSLTLPKTNSSPLKMGLPKRKLVFQASISRGYVSFRGCSKQSSITWVSKLGFLSYSFQMLAITIKQDGHPQIHSDRLVLSVWGNTKSRGMRSWNIALNFTLYHWHLFIRFQVGHTSGTPKSHLAWSNLWWFDSLKRPSNFHLRLTWRKTWWQNFRKGILDEQGCDYPTSATGQTTNKNILLRSMTPWRQPKLGGGSISIHPRSLTAKAPEKLPGPNRKGSSSNHHFSGPMLNFQGVAVVFIHTKETT